MWRANHQGRAQRVGLLGVIDLRGHGGLRTGVKCKAAHCVLVQLDGQRGEQGGYDTVVPKVQVGASIQRNLLAKSAAT